MSSPDLTVIGLDSATFDVVDPMLAAGELPNLERLCDSGSARGPPLDDAPAHAARVGDDRERASTPAGTASGTSPSGTRPATSSGSSTAASAGRRPSGTTSPLGSAGGDRQRALHLAGPEVDGFAIAGFDAAAREQGLTYPEELRDELRQRFGSLELDNRFPLTDGRLDLDLVRRAAAQKVEIVTWLAERFDPELLFVVFMAADHIHHLCWTDWEADGPASPVAEVYRILDEATGALAGLAGDDGNVLVLSDHGAGPLHGVVNLNAWLAAEGFLAYATGGGVAGRKLLGECSSSAATCRSGSATRPSSACPACASGRSSAATTPSWTGRGPGVRLRDLRQHRPQRPGPRGARDRRARRRVRAGSRRDRRPAPRAARPRGETIVARVHRREDLFHGPELAKVPDLLVEFDRYAWLGKGNLKSRSESLWDEIEIEGGSEHSYVGSHRHEGIVVLSGPAVAPGAPVGGELVDVAPTILYLLGESIPADLEGRILVEALRPGLLDERPPAYDDEAPAEFAPERAELEEEGAAEVERRLRGLGYLE